MRIAKHAVLIACLSLSSFALPLRAADAPPATPVAKPTTTKPAGAPTGIKDQATLDRELSAMLTNVRLVGGYNANDIDGDKKNDGYTILSAKRGEGDEWIIVAQVDYKGVGLPIELKIPVIWAGDTPILTMTNHKIMGMGSFTVRLMFFDNQYAGTWSSPRHGGQMWGRIEKIVTPRPADPLIQPKKE